MAGRDYGLIGRHVGDIDAAGRRALVEVGLRHGVVGNQFQIPPVLRLIERQLRLVLGDLRLGLFQHRLVGPRVEFEEDVALLDQRALLEVDLFQVAPGVRPDLDGIDRGDPGGELRVVGDLLLNRVADRDRERRCRRRFGGRPRTARQPERECEEHARNGGKRASRFS